MKKQYINKVFLVVISLISGMSNIEGQQYCDEPPVGCDKTDLSNYGFSSNNDANTIEYDNLVSGFHATFSRNGDGTFSIWGQGAASNGTGDVLSPLEINATNYPGLTGIPIKTALGTRGGSSDRHQFVVLTTHGLFVWGEEGILMNEDITSGTSFQRVDYTKMNSSADTTGLPSGVTPGDVKMMFGTRGTLAITTCSGSVWVLSMQEPMRGAGSSGTSSTDQCTWRQVRTSGGGHPVLTNIVATRGCYNSMFALDSSGKLWTWGVRTYLGNNTGINSNVTYATQMTWSLSRIKMIGMTCYASSTDRISYYVLDTLGKVYALGANNKKQLGDFTTTERQAWVQCRYDNTPTYMSDIVWISPNEHDGTTATTNPAINVLNKYKKVWAWGSSKGSMIGRGSSDNYDPGVPSGLGASADSFLTVETGGHTSMVIKQCESHFGYVGHRINGSMGNGSATNTTESSYTYATAPVDICGAGTKPNLKIKPKIDFGSSGSDNCYETEYVLTNAIKGAKYVVLSDTGNVVDLDSLNPDTSYLRFDEPGYIQVMSYIKDVCSNIYRDTSNFTAIKCKFTTPDVNMGFINIDLKGDVSTNDSIVYSATPYGSASLVKSPSGSSPNLSLSSDGKYTFDSDKPGSYVYKIDVCNPGQSSGCPTEYLMILLKDKDSLSNFPFAGTDIASTKKNIAVTLPTLDNDQSGAPGGLLDTSSISIVAASAPNPVTEGSLSINPSTGAITFTPVSGFVGEVTYYYEVCDQSSIPKCGIGMQRVYVNGRGVQNTTLSSDDFHSKVKNIKVTGNILLNDLDPEGNTQSATPKTVNTSGVGKYEVVANGDYTFTPAMGFYGTANFENQVCDNGTPVACTKSTIYFVVENDYTEPDVNKVEQGKIVSGDLHKNDNLPVGYFYGNLQADIGNPSADTPVLNSDGTYTFTTSTIGLYHFEIDVCTPGANPYCYTEKLTINVTDPISISNLPVTTKDLAIMEGHPSSPSTITINVRANDNIANIFGKVNSGVGTLSNPTIKTNKNGATISVNGSGNVTYKPKNGFYGIDTFTYEVCELPGGSLCKEEMVIVTVNDIDAPVDIIASDDYNTTYSNTKLTVSSASQGVQINDFTTQDGGSWQSRVGGNVSVRRTTSLSVTGGSINMEDDGTYEFQPSLNFVGTAVIPYTTCRGTLCAGGTLYIQVFDLTLLPVKLIDFEAEKIGDRQVELYWKTSSEENNNYFTIERSSDMENWIEVGRVAGAGTSYQENQYMLRDNSAPTGILYYRLSQTDYDGAENQIGVAKVGSEDIDSKSFILYPNPCRNELNVGGFIKSTVHYEIYNTIGKKVLGGEGAVGRELKINVEALPGGTYFFILSDKSGVKSRIAFIKED